MPTKNMNLPTLMERFHSEEKCRDFLEGLRWPNGIACPRCGGSVISRIRERAQFDCDSCRYQFSVKAGTVLQDSKLPLSKWLLATFIMVESKKGVSSNQLKRMLGVSYKTAWFLSHRIRAAMQVVNERQLEGIVEVDETYVGGKTRGKGRGYRGNKTMVLVAVERDGEIRLKVEKRNDRKTLHGFIEEHVADDTEAIYTDEWPAYRGIEDDDTRHETVNHSVEEWVRGQVHTNTAESVNSLLKRSIIGSYHHLSAKHLPAYLDEIEWRFNNRHNPYLFRDTLKALVSADELTYRELVTG